ncbi:MAG: outer membrane beta-barrel protein [Bacteroidetes bacterium]|nr:outer membrane beta-barrel protein [Bacteroidota bacterium]
MSNLSDKELDRLSREAAEQFEPDEEISSWEKLEQQLSREIEDQPPATPTRFGARPLGYGALLLLLAGASYFLLKTDNDSKSSTLKNKVSTEASKQSGDKLNTPPATGNAKNQSDKTDTKNESGAVAKSGDAANNSSSKDESSLSKKNIPAAGEHKNIAGKANDVAINNTEKNQKNSDDNSLTVLSAKKSVNKNHNKNNIEIVDNTISTGFAGNGNNNSKIKAGNKNKRAKSTQAPKTDVANANDVVVNQSENASGKNKIVLTEETDKPKYAKLPGLAFVDFSANGISDSSLSKITSNTNNNAAQQKNQSLRINRSLKIGLMAGPDITLVHSANGGRFSGNFGLTIGYQFAKRLSINTGIIYTKKYYASQGGNFHAPSDWQSYPNTKLDYVTGDCSMWEIPLSLRYDFPMGPKISYFVNGGLSSYLMKNESYDIYYRTGNWGPTPSYVKTWSGNSNKKYWVSVLNLSAGIEHQFSKSFSLQAEPFVKIPLTGVGIGNLQLNSYGVIFSLRYSPVLSRSRH